MKEKTYIFRAAEGDLESGARWRPQNLPSNFDGNIISEKILYNKIRYNS